MVDSKRGEEKKLLAKIFVVKIFLAKIFAAKIFLAKIFSTKIFMKKYFYKNKVSLIDVPPHSLNCVSKQQVLVLLF